MKSSGRGAQWKFRNFSPRRSHLACTCLALTLALRLCLLQRVYTAVYPCFSTNPEGCVERRRVALSEGHNNQCEASRISLSFSKVTMRGGGGGHDEQRGAFVGEDRVQDILSICPATMGSGLQALRSETESGGRLRVRAVARIKALLEQVKSNIKVCAPARSNHKNI